MSVTLTTAGGTVVARSNTSAFLAAQVRSLVTKRYPAFLRSSGGGEVVEVARRGGRWIAVDRAEPPNFVRPVIDILNDTETNNQGE